MSIFETIRTTPLPEATATIRPYLTHEWSTTSEIADRAGISTQRALRLLQAIGSAVVDRKDVPLRKGQHSAATKLVWRLQPQPDSLDRIAGRMEKIAANMMALGQRMKEGKL